MASDPPVALPPEQQQQRISDDTQFSIWTTFKPHIPRLILTILMDVIFPLVIYFLLQKYITPVYALLVAGAPPLVMVIIKAVLLRSFDAIGFLVFSAFVIAGVVAIISQNAIILLLEKSLVTGILSVVFGITLIPFNCCNHRYQLRPLAYYFYQDLVPTTRDEIGLPESVFTNEQHENNGLLSNSSDKDEVGQVYEWIYTHCPSFRHSCYLITTICSIGFLLEFLARLSLILMHFSIGKIIIYGDTILTLITIICIVLGLTCVAIERQHTLVAIKQWKEENLNVQE